MPTAKYLEIAGTLQQQIKDKVFALNELPSERKMASQFGVSYMTARKAAQKLVTTGVLKRGSKGRLEIKSPKSRANVSPTIGFVMHAPVSMWSTQWSWQRDLSQIVERRHGIVRPISYVGASDPVIFDALDGDFDGLFMILPTQISPLLADRLARKRGQVVVLWQDVSHLGIPSIETAPARYVCKILDHLQALGHRRIDCLYTQPIVWSARQRIVQWQSGLEQRGLEGRFHDFSASASGPSTLAARKHVGEMLDRGELDATALFCVDTSHAWGAMRACQDRALCVGKDISICGFGEMEIAQMLNPSVTAIKPAGRAEFLSMGLDWIGSRGRGWTGPLRLVPDDVSLFIGESTGPVPSASLSRV